MTHYANLAEFQEKAPEDLKSGVISQAQFEQAKSRLSEPVATFEDHLREQAIQAAVAKSERLSDGTSELDQALASAGHFNLATSRLAQSAVLIPGKPETEQEQNERFTAIREWCRLHGWQVAVTSEERVINGHRVSPASLVLTDEFGSVKGHGGVPEIEAAIQMEENRRKSEYSRIEAQNAETDRQRREFAETYENMPVTRAEFQKFREDVLNAVRDAVKSYG